MGSISNLLVAKALNKEALFIQDLQWCLDEDFPIGTELTPLEREREAHIAFAEARRRVYIGREEYFERISDYMKEDQDKPLVILGESGMSVLVCRLDMQVYPISNEMFAFMLSCGTLVLTRKWTGFG